ncbi:MAG: Gfo/Idh/MocA family oxidoreductase [Gemmataceae bacterium]|nr:Gfo/Idh/MocA family oxidoreductase [Gemmataceae bacterium]
MTGPIQPTRRDAMLTTGTLAAGVLAGVAIPAVHAAEDNEIKVALVGCGGRGANAAENALSTKSGPIKLVAMADVYKDKLDNAHKALKRGFDKQVDVPDSRKFVEFEGYKKAMDALNPGDVVILATPPAFRWVHFTYAIQKGLNVFMEKPVTVDGPTSVRMLKLGVESVKKNLKVGVGLMCRHCDARKELYKRIKDGMMGDITLLRAYRVSGLTATASTAPKPKGVDELEYQIRNFHAFLWASGGGYSDFLIHNIDESCWMKDAWPVKAMALGGRHYKEGWIDQNFDSYSVEYTFADGTKLYLGARNINDCYNEFASYAHGTKGSAVISQSGHSPARCRIYPTHDMSGKIAPKWRAGRERNPYQLEWDYLIEAIRKDKPHNEVKRGVEASVVTSMGRLSAHTGTVVTYEEMLNHDHEFAPDVDKLVVGGAPPIKADEKGRYPVPNPGKKAGDKKREYKA